MSYFERIWSEAPDAAPERFELRRDHLIRRLPAGVRVLDVGCGSGWFSAALSEAGFAVTGVDVAAEALRRARLRASGVEFALAREGAELPFEAGSFGAAWLGEVLEHVQDGIALLEEVARVLEPDGVLIASTPDHRFALRLRLALSRGAFERHFDPRSDHVRFYTASSLRTLLEVCGFEQIAVTHDRGTLFVSCSAPR
ncbi:MAG TPA: class I SAM-dependent methyltransferase [Solirubrobacteraceae bacterium]|nr:class I SAM-dependent methyltransferase [Solirubrobacteraceae bacterium]